MTSLREILDAIRASGGAMPSALARRVVGEIERALAARGTARSVSPARVVSRIPALVLRSKTARSRFAVPSSRSRLRIDVVDGPDRGLEVSPERNVVRVGTSPQADVVLTDRTVSREHCELTLREDAIQVRDRGSANGTSVEGVQVRDADVRPGASAAGAVPPWEEALDRFERRYFEAALRRSGGNVSAAARDAGVNRKLIQRVVKRLGIDVGE